MKSSLIFKVLLATTLLGLIGASLKIFNDNQLKKANRPEYCRDKTPLAENKLKKYDKSGVKRREGEDVKVNGGTMYRQVSFKTKPVVSVVIFPEALDGKIWSKVPQSAIKYIGKGGDRNSLREWFSPDYFYLLEVPEGAKGLAFGRLCEKNGDATVYSIRKWEQTGNNKISINSKIHLENSKTLPKINSSHILVNTGSNQKDTLGEATEVYFTKERVRIPSQKK